MREKFGDRLAAAQLRRRSIVKQMLQIVLKPGLEGFERGERLTARIHFDVEIVREAEFFEFEQLEGDCGLRIVDQPSIEPGGVAETLVQGIEHIQCRLNRRVKFPTPKKPCLVLDDLA